MAALEFAVAKGESKWWILEARGLIDGQLINLDTAQAKIYFVVKVKGVGSVIIRRRSLLAGGGASEIEVLDQNLTPGQFKIKLTNVETAALDPLVVYFCDCWIVTPDEHLQVVEESHFNVKRSVTTDFSTAP